MLFHNGDFHFGCTVTPLYFTPVFEEGNIVDGRLDAQDQMEFVVHFDGDLTHAVFDACSLNAGVKIVAHLVAVITVEFPAKVGGDILGFNRVDGRSDTFLINGGKIALAFEDDVGGVFYLHQAPVKAVRKVFDNGAVEFGEVVEQGMERFGPQAISKLLSFLKILDEHKCVIEGFEPHALGAKARNQPVVGIEIELNAKRSPRRYAQVTEPEILVDEIEVVMQAFPILVAQKCFVSFLVVPGLK